MKYKFQRKITFEINEPFDINYINTICKNNPNQNILVEVKNTKGITLSQLRQLSSSAYIRVAGGYDEERVKRRKNVIFENGETGNYYTDAVIYTRNELIKIVEEIEKIESGISKNWDDTQKIIYVYDKLKSGILYDPKYKRKPSSEIRSLRGLITKQTVCAGYSLILKEILDRQGIKCEYVEGKTNKEGGHAWNIVEVEGKKHGIDLTWDSSRYNSGKFNRFEFLGQDVKEFSETHIPDKEEKNQNYKQSLSSIDVNIIKEFSAQIGRSREYQTTVYDAERKDGSKFVVAQIGDRVMNEKYYYRYYYVDIDKNGKQKNPLILYSDLNLADFMNYKRKNINHDFDKIKKIESLIENVLFSKENIYDSLAKGTYFIGTIKKFIDNKIEYIENLAEIKKEEKNLFIYPTKQYIRSDGTIFASQQMLEEPFEINGVKVMRYDIFELIKENGKEIVKRNTVFTERNFFKDQRQSMIDDFLSRERLDRKANEAGGYIGYYDANGIRTYNPDLVEHFKIIGNSSINLKNKSNSNSINIPSFEELKDITSKYEIVIDSKEPSKINVRNINTGQIEQNKKLTQKAIFANIWLVSSGVRWIEGEKRNGMYYAFNDKAKELYNLICKELLNDVKNNGVIDTVKLFNDIDKNNNYSYNKEIIVNLFRTPYQTELINEMFLESIGNNKPNKIPEPLYTLNYAANLDYNSTRKTR